MSQPWTVKSVPVAVLLLVTGFVLDAVTIVHTYEHMVEVFAPASTKDDSMNGSVAVLYTWGVGALSLLVMGLSTVLLCTAVVGLLRDRPWGRTLALVVFVPNALFTAVALPAFGWRDRAALDPNDLSAYFDPATTPPVVRFADVADVPFGFAGAVGGLLLLVVPASRRWYERRRSAEAPEPVSAR
ncbi:hypothetical protein ADK67_35975 [Saccharothrix sp. NRRL B-16348]|uniref:hypothetical protein n=1 Tax=Saccharothrix sp. NRRL B-16348 TaxID=1415542 RepID=UPI0006AE2E83|nr:hypothetical protein [Saccharothrix sp. NRRL B-16348]KOX18607.1 hypothetical protein ADK67_35975 [Saccharothrix sp. NRRL B-16348]